MQKGEAGARLAIAERDLPTIHVYDVRSGSDERVASVKARAATLIMAACLMLILGGPDIDMYRLNITCCGSKQQGPVVSSRGRDGSPVSGLATGVHMHAARCGTRAYACMPRVRA